jgi:hypothetical protein
MVGTKREVDFLPTPSLFSRLLLPLQCISVDFDLRNEERSKLFQATFLAPTAKEVAEKYKELHAYSLLC